MNCVHWLLESFVENSTSLYCKMKTRSWNVDCNTESVQLQYVGQYVSGKPLQHPFDLVQASWTPCGGLGGWFHSRATDVAAPIAGLIGIGYVALIVCIVPLHCPQPRWVSMPLLRINVVKVNILWPIDTYMHQRTGSSLLKQILKKIRKNIYRSNVQVTWALWSLHMFTGLLFKIKLHLLSTVLLTGFQSFQGALKATDYASTW